MPKIMQSTFNEIEDLWQELKQYDDKSEIPKHVDEKNKELTSLLLSVARAKQLHRLSKELQEVAHERFEALKALGDWDTLRQPRIGLEKGVKRPLSLSEEKSKDELRDAIKRYTPGRKKTQVLRKLQAEEILPRKYSRQAFNKLLATLDIDDFDN